MTNALANQFGPLTDEQRRILESQAIRTEMPPWLDLLLSGGLGGLGGRMAARGMAHAGEFASSMMFPTLSTMAGMAGHRPDRIVNWAGRVGGGIGGMMGAGASIDAARRANMLLDAEGQPGGFYGQPLPTSGDAEGQPGGFYGNYYGGNALMRSR